MNVIRCWPRDRPLPAGAKSIVAQAPMHLVLIANRFPDHPQQRRPSMNILGYLLSGGFAKGYRTQILGVGAALSVVAMWAVGDMSLTDLLAKLPVVLGGLGLAALGAKVDDAKASAPAKQAKAK
jgi:hypothetical protein